MNTFKISIDTTDLSNESNITWSVLVVATTIKTQLRDKVCLEEGMEHIREWRGNQLIHMLCVLVVKMSAENLCKFNCGFREKTGMFRILRYPMLEALTKNN